MKTCASLGLTLGLLLSSTVAFADIDLAVVKTGPQTVVAGTDLLYEITVFNAGADPATDVLLTDIYSLPPLGELGGGGAASCSDGTDNDDDDDIDQADTECEGLIYVGASQPCQIAGSTPTEGTILCTLPDLASGESVTFTIKFHVSAAYLIDKGLFATNEASVDANEADPNLVNNVDSVDTVVEEVADLKITKISEPTGTAPAGSQIYYTVYVDNFGPSAARNVTIRDSLLSSSNVDVLSCAFSVSQGGGAITQFTCATGSLVQTQFGTDIGTFKTNFLYPLTPTSEGRLRASFRLTAKDELDINNLVRVTSDTFDPNVDNNETDVDISVTPVADLQAFSVFGAEVQVNGQAGKVFNSSGITPMPDAPNYNFGGTTVTAGRRIQWDTTTLNAGPSAAHNVVIEVLLPAGATVIPNTLTGLPNAGAVPGRCYTDPAGEPRRSVICEYGTLEMGEQASVRFLILIDPNVPAGTFLSLESVTHGDDFDPDNSNNVTSIQYTVNNWADLTLEKSAVGPAVAGTTLSYELRVANKGPSTAHDVTLRDSLPAGATFIDAFVDHDGEAIFSPLPCALGAGSNTLFCPLGDVMPTGTAPVLVVVNVALGSDLDSGAVLTNSANVLLADTPDPVPADNSDSVDTDITTLADVQLVKTSSADIVGPASRIDFKLTMTNNGPSVAHDIVVTDNLPPQSAVYLFDSGGCSLNGLVLTCDVGTLGLGESTSFNVYMIPKGKKGTITNTATAVSTTDDNDLDNNTSSKTVLIKGGKGAHQGK